MGGVHRGLRETEAGMRCKWSHISRIFSLAIIVIQSKNKII